MANYIIRISEAPREYEIEAETKEEAEAQAKEKYNSDTNGKSIYEIQTLKTS